MIRRCEAAVECKRSRHSVVKDRAVSTPKVITVLPAFATIATPLREIVFGAILIGLLIWEPGGLAMLLRKLKRYLDLWPFSY